MIEINPNEKIIMTPDEMIKELKSELKEYKKTENFKVEKYVNSCLLYTSPSPRDRG